MSLVDKSRQFIPLSQLEGQRDRITIFDEHTHTNRSSDGIDHWKTDITAAKKSGLDGIANTEHDTVSKQQKMSELAEELGLLFIHGLELTARYKNVFPHIIILNKERQILKELLKNIKVNPSEPLLPLALRAPLYALIVFGGSDAHQAEKVGDVVTWVEGKYQTSSDLIDALKTRPTGTAYRYNLLPSD